MQMRFEELEKDPLYRKLEKIIKKRNFWPGHEFDTKAFHAYCEASVIEADIMSGKISAKKYNSLLAVSDALLARYLLKSGRTNLRTGG